MVQVMTNCDSVVELRRAYRTTPDAIYKAWTDPSTMGRWMAPRPYVCEKVELDVRAGGRYRIAMFNPENGNRPVVGGVYESVDPGKKLVFTWKWENNESCQEDSRVTVELIPIEGGTEVRLLHEKLPNVKERDSHVKGWSACLEQLEEGI